MVEVAAFHYFLLACGLGLEMCTVMGCLALTGRFAPQGGAAVTAAHRLSLPQA